MGSAARRLDRCAGHLVPLCNPSSRGDPDSGWGPGSGRGPPCGHPRAEPAAAAATELPALPELQFERFYRAAELSAFCSDLAAAAPHLCRCSSLGDSAEGQPIPLLTITAFPSVEGPTPRRPTHVIYGGIHAHEPATSVLKLP